MVSFTRAATRTVWGGHASARAVALLAVAHALVVVLLCASWTRLRPVLFDFREVRSEASLAVPPEILASHGYTEDALPLVARYRDIALPIVEGAATDGEKLRRLGDYIYSLRKPGAPEVASDVREGLESVWATMGRGDLGNCGHMSEMLASMWRGLGGHSRTVEWATVEGEVGHIAVELYSTASRRWMYYDMNVNGYWTDEEGTPLSLASVRSNLLTEEDVHLVSNRDERFYDWSPQEFRESLLQYPIEWYALNNVLTYMDPSRRFGRFNRFYSTLHLAPYPYIRILDNLTGERDRRLVVDGKIQIAGLLTFDGARLLLAYCLLMVAFCCATLVFAGYSARRNATRSDFSCGVSPMLKRVL